MKKNKLILISILGLLLLVPFITPTIAAPAPYVPVAEEEKYYWTMEINYLNWATFDADNMSDTLANLFNTAPLDTMQAVKDSWSYYWDQAIQAWWPMTINTILPENTSAFLFPDFSISDNITHTPIYIDAGYEHTFDAVYYSDTWYVVNDSASFATQSLYGGALMSLYGTLGIPFAPKNMNWVTFAAAADAGMDTHWGGWAGNTTVTAITDGYSMSVPVAGYENNTLAITVNATYNTNSILNYSSFEYGPDILYEWKLLSVDPDAVDPVITDSPSNFTVDEGYTGESLSWTATDANPGNYTITRDVTTVVTTTPWSSGTPVVYNIPDGLMAGTYIFTIDFTDTSTNSISDSVAMTVTSPDVTDPVITMAPIDLVVEFGAIGQSLSWTATDANAGTYTIILNGSDVVVAATPWVSGTPVTYNIPNYLNYVPSVTTYEITFSDISGNSVSDSATITVGPIPTTAPTPPDIPGFEPLIIIGITGIASISLIALKKKKK